MVYSNFTFIDHIGLEIFVHKWAPENEIKGLVLFAHGVAEHSGRYDFLGKRLVKEGYALFAQDQRGHGKSIINNQKGYFGEDGLEGVILNLKQQLEIMKANYPNKPVFYLGHSNGSLLGQTFIQRYGDELQGAIFSASYGKQDFMNILVPLGKILKPFVNKKKEAGLFHNMSIGSFNKAFEDEGTENPFISSKKEIVKEYDESPLTGFRMPNQYFLEISALLKENWKKKNEEKIPKDLPILFLSGEFEPLSKFNENLMPLIERYKILGIKKVDYKIYEKARHEVLNDVSREEAINDIISFLNKHV